MIEIWFMCARKIPGKQKSRIRKPARDRNPRNGKRQEFEMSQHDTGPAYCRQCDYTPSDQPCDECGAGPGERCMPYCTVPFGPGGPFEHHDPADHDTHTATPDDSE